MLAALMLPRVLRSISDRSVMITGAFSLAATLSVFATMTLGTAGEIAWSFLLAGWLALGVTFSLSVTPGGRLLRRSSNEGDRPAVFAAQFALSHVCWLVAYPVAGLIGASSVMGVAFLALAAIAAIGATSALRRWPKIDPRQIAHEHPELPSDHPHLIEHDAKELL